MSLVEVIVWSCTCDVVFMVSLYFIGGGFICSVPLFVCLLCLLYWSDNIKAGGEGVIRSTILTNFRWIWSSDKRLVILVLVFGTYRVLMTIHNPSLETRKGGAYSLILFTALICLLYVLPEKILLLVNYVRQLSCHDNVLWCVMYAASYTLLSTMVAFVVYMTYLFDAQLTGSLQRTLAMASCDPVLESIPPYSSLLAPDERSTDRWNASTTVSPVFVIIRDALMMDGEYLGSMNTFLPILIGLYLLSRIFLPDRHSLVVMTLFYTVQASCVGGLTSALVKHTGHRFRPSAFSNPYVWNGLGHTSFPHGLSGLDCSFPSGHATVTTAVTSVIFLAVVRRISLSILSTLVLFVTVFWSSFLVMINRVSNCEHWPSDVLFAMFLGHVIARGVLLGSDDGSQTNSSDSI
ncbi:uncharacterized protein [Dysidea avara]|uniref:uncharacterized protein isoform X2 n=1 Tax=Dysidea avara TaxID=196820 RepID=UPI00331DC536